MEEIQMERKKEGKVLIGKEMARKTRIKRGKANENKGE